MADLIDKNNFWMMLLILHGMMAVALLGALTHQTFSLRSQQAIHAVNLIQRFQRVNPTIYTNTICLLWICTFILGAWIYANYRINVRIPLEQMGFMKTQGLFELKEHLSTFGFLLLPVYFSLWKSDLLEFEKPKKYITFLLCAICWFSFLTGHVVNNIRGIGQ